MSGLVVATQLRWQVGMLLHWLVVLPETGSVTDTQVD